MNESKSCVDDYSHKFYQQYNDRLRNSVDTLDKKLAVFNSMPEEERRNLMGCDIDLSNKLLVPINPYASSVLFRSSMNGQGLKDHLLPHLEDQR